MSTFSPRTAAEPMAFSRSDFRRGAFASWICFMVLLIVALVVPAILNSGLPWGPPWTMIALYLMFGVPIGGVVSAIVVLVTAPALLRVSRRLAKTSRISVHVVVYASFGAILGLVIATMGVLLARGDVGYSFSTGFPWIVAAMCALSVVSGWGWTVWRQRRRPRMPEHDDTTT
jgi:uncharacterized protein YacL